MDDGSINDLAERINIRRMTKVNEADIELHHFKLKKQHGAELFDEFSNELQSQVEKIKLRLDQADDLTFRFDNQGIQILKDQFPSVKFQFRQAAYDMECSGEYHSFPELRPFNANDKKLVVPLSVAPDGRVYFFFEEHHRTPKELACRVMNLLFDPQ
jgi:hypothetical protein